MRAVQDTSIPSFALYGDHAGGSASELDFVHIEDIRSRSERYQWEIDTHVHHALFQVLCLLSGGGEATIDDRSVAIGDASVVVIPPGTVHAFQFQPGTHGYVLTIAEPLLFAQCFSRPMLMTLAHDPAQRLGRIMAEISVEFSWPQPKRTQMLELLVRTVLLLLERQQQDGGEPPMHSELFERFRRLLEEHFSEQWTVDRYAAALIVTATKLNRLCRSISGKSAFELVQERLLLEAKRRLLYVNIPVSLLAYELGFRDPAYFCRFFKKHTGMRPSAYRQQRQLGGPG
ncbi:helix-turn-helix domain-containing protein [Denitratisoma sp. agr-D3]